MRDYTFNGVPVSQITDADLNELLQGGFVITSGDGVPNVDSRVRERLRLEKFIRDKGLRK